LRYVAFFLLSCETFFFDVAFLRPFLVLGSHSFRRVAFLFFYSFLFFLFRDTVVLLRANDLIVVHLWWLYDLNLDLAPIIPSNDDLQFEIQRTRINCIAVPPSHQNINEMELLNKLTDNDTPMEGEVEVAHYQFRLLLWVIGRKRFCHCILEPCSTKNGIPQ